MKFASVTLLISIIAIIAGQQYATDLASTRELQTTVDNADGSTTVTNADCNDSVTDDVAGTYYDGSSKETCSAELTYDACPCYGKMT